MTFRLFYFILLIPALASCNNNKQDSPKINKDSSAFLKTKYEKPVAEILEVKCDSIYKNKDYKLTLTHFDTTINDPDLPNTIFAFYKFANGKYLRLFEDTIYCERQDLHFEKLNTDEINEILVSNNTDVRSNWTYYLYVVDTTNDRIKRIKGFEKIKNPEFIPEYDLIDNYVVSGRNWTGFYKIKGDSIKDFDIVIYDDQTDELGHKYKYAFENAIRKIMREEKNSY